MDEKKYIEREAVNALIKAECSPKVAAYLIDAVATIPAADAIEVEEDTDFYTKGHLYIGYAEEGE